VNRLKRLTRGGSLPGVPLEGAEGARWSVISSAADLTPQPSDELVATMLAAASAAVGIKLTELRSRSDSEYALYVDTWPGEHYRFLAALVATRRPKVVVEVGTYLGHGSLALLSGSDDVRVITYDVVPAQEVGGAVLRDSDISNGRLEQRIGDLADPTFLASQIETLCKADLLFVDGPKDGRWERTFCERVLPALSDRRRLAVFDDIRLLEMVQLWRDLPYPKLDATSVGHWSGTGLVEIGSTTSS
jgi:predicted O-methyltransferase YrrM